MSSTPEAERAVMTSSTGISGLDDVIVNQLDALASVNGRLMTSEMYVRERLAEAEEASEERMRRDRARSRQGEYDSFVTLENGHRNSSSKGVKSALVNGHGQFSNTSHSVEATPKRNDLNPGSLNASEKKIFKLEGELASALDKLRRVEGERDRLSNARAIDESNGWIENHAKELETRTREISAVTRHSFSTDEFDRDRVGSNRSLNHDETSEKLLRRIAELETNDSLLRDNLAEFVGKENERKHQLISRVSELETIDSALRRNLEEFIAKENDRKHQLILRISELEDAKRELRRELIDSSELFHVERQRLVSTIQDLERNLKRRGEELAAKDEELREARGRNDSLERKNDSLERDVRKLRSDLKSPMDKALEMSRGLDEANSTIARLREEFQRRGSGFRQLAEANDGGFPLCNSYSNHEEMQQNGSETHDDEDWSINRIHDAKSVGCKICQAQLDSLRKQHQQLQSRLDRVTNESKSEGALTATECVEHRKVLKAALEAGEGLVERLGEQEGLLRDQGRVLTATQAELQASRVREKQLKRDLDTIATEKSEAEHKFCGEIETLRETLENCRTHKKQLDCHVMDLNQSKADLEEKVKDLKEQLGRSDQLKMGALSELEQVKGLSAQQTIAIRDLEQNIIILKEKVAGCKTDNANLKESLSFAETLLAEYHQESRDASNAEFPDFAGFSDFAEFPDFADDFDGIFGGSNSGSDIRPSRENEKKPGGHFAHTFASGNAYALDRLTRRDMVGMIWRLERRDARQRTRVRVLEGNLKTLREAVEGATVVMTTDAIVPFGGRLDWEVWRIRCLIL